MRNYTVCVVIKSIGGEGQAEDTEVHLGSFPADSIAALVKAAGTLGAAFVKKDAVAEHKRLVAAQNKET